jgi:hypothetical protein
MKNIYIIHTQFNRAYSSNLVNTEFEIISKNVENEYGGEEEKEFGFGVTQSIALVYQKNRLIVDFECTKLNENHPDNLIILISDELFLSDPKTVLERLKGILTSVACRISPIYHQRNTFNEFIVAFEKEFKDKIIVPINTFSHYVEDETSEWQENPFYALVELVNSQNEDEYKETLRKIASFLPTDKTIQEANEQKEKLKLLYNLLGTSISEETKKTYQNLRTEYEDLPDIKDRFDVEFLKNVRDIILNKTV